MSERHLTVDELIQCETTKRLNEMQRNDYSFPKQISCVDWFVIVTIILLSQLLIIWCMFEDM